MYASFFITRIIENEFLILSIKFELATPYIYDELYVIQVGSLNKKKAKSKVTNCLLFFLVKTNLFKMTTIIKPFLLVLLCNGNKIVYIVLARKRQILHFDRLNIPRYSRF